LNSIGLLSLVFAVAVILTAVGVELFRRNSLKNNWIDHPNERSSHSQPTPRGAGLVIVLVCLAAYLIISFIVPGYFSWGYLIGAVMVASISWVDDLYSVPFILRLLTHLGAAIAVVSDLGYFESFGLSSESAIQLPVIGALVTIVWIVWVINAYNFMDGIDGIAGIQALVAAAAWTAVSVGTAGMSSFSLVIAGAVLGFILHNWQPARVFMGDVGSAFVGFTFATAPLIWSHERQLSLPSTFIVAALFLWPFMVDSIFTLMRRALNGERLWEAHRKHLYQRLVVNGFSHAFVSVLYGAFAVFSSVAAFVVLFVGGNSARFSLASVLIVSILFVIVIWFKSADSKKLSADQL